MKTRIRLPRLNRCVKGVGFPGGAYPFETLLSTFPPPPDFKVIFACPFQERSFKVMESALPFFSNGTNFSLISFVSKFFVRRKDEIKKVR